MGWAGGKKNKEQKPHCSEDEKPEGNRLFGRPRRRWEDNAKMGR
jgi:hypothetical protein